jgi:hypothetical protein
MLAVMCDLRVFVFAAAMNELTWARVQQWEALHRCRNVKLRRFLGRPDELRYLQACTQPQGQQFQYNLQPFRLSGWIWSTSNIISIIMHQFEFQYLHT